MVMGTIPATQGTTNAELGVMRAANLLTFMQPTPKMSDLQTVFADIKIIQSTAISDLKADIHSVAARYKAVEEMVPCHDTSLQQVLT